MPIDPTARLTNAKRALYAWLDGQVASLPGAPELVLEDAHRAAGTGPWLRAIVQPLTARRTGRYDADQLASWRTVLLVVDLFWPRDSANRYEIDDAAEVLVDALDLLSLGLYDHSDPGSPELIEGARLRQIEPAPEAQRLPLADEYSRRQVRARFGWTSRRTA